MVGLDLDDRQIGFPVSADYFGRVYLLVILELDGHLVCAVDDVVVGDDQSVRGDDEAGTLAALDAGLLALLAEELVELVEEVTEGMSLGYLLAELLAQAVACGGLLRRYEGHSLASLGGQFREYGQTVGPGCKWYDHDKGEGKGDYFGFSNHYILQKICGKQDDGLNRLLQI